MDNEGNEHNLSRRIFILSAGKVALTSLILGRMFYLQVIEGRKYSLLAEKNRISWRFMPNPRGLILDCTGKEIAGNMNAFHLVVDYEARKNIKTLLSKLQKFVTVTPKQEARLMKDIKRNPAYIPIVIKEHLTWDEVTQIELNSTTLSGVYVASGHRRAYPNGHIFGVITGYVSTPTQKDVDEDPLLKLPGLRLGRQGMEQVHNAQLRGEPAYEQLEVNANLKAVRKLSSSPGQKGASLPLTIHHDLQIACWNLISAHHAGSCMIMDTHTGAIRAFVSHPYVDPSKFIDGMSSTHWQELQNDPLTPLLNRITCATYPPGSTTKMLVALAALEEEIIDEHTHFHCSGAMPLGSHIFHCWKNGGHGNMALKEALAASCDVYFYQLALKVGAGPIADMARRFGLGEKSGIDLPQEKAGLIPDPGWKRKVKETSWYPGDTLNFAIGQGFMNTTPLQLARMTAALANGGHLVTPHLASPSADFEWMEPFTIDPRHLNLVCEGLRQAIHTPRGTCFGASAHTHGISMAGKTGSSQVKRIHLADRLAGLHRSQAKAWEDMDHALFVGYAPFDSPRYAVCVVVDHGGSGGRIAAPIGVQALSEAIKLLG